MRRPAPETEIKILRVVAVVALILLLIFVLIPATRFWVNGTTPKPKFIKPMTAMDSLKFRTSETEQRRYLDSLQFADQIQFLIDKMDTCCDKGTVSKPTKKRTTTYIPEPPKDTKSLTLDKDVFKPTTREKTVESTTYNIQVGGSSIRGLKDGDAYCTVSDDGYLMYVFAKRLYDEAKGTATPELFYKGSGKHFTLVGNNYVFVDKSSKVDLRTKDEIKNWSVFIGGKYYDIYIPHENTKGDIARARGSITGIITPEDVKKIGALNPEVAKGRIAPNGERVTGSDNQIYEGWQFVTPIAHEVITK